MADEKILRPNFGDPKILPDRTSGLNCRHEYVFVQINKRIVICRMCREPVDPFEVLKEVAFRWERATYLQQQADEAGARLTAFEHEERLIKARLRAAYRKAPEPKNVLFYEAAIERLNRAETYVDVQNTVQWVNSLPWFTPEQANVLAEAERRARLRAEEARRKNRRRRGVRVIDGGSDELATEEIQAPAAAEAHMPPEDVR